MNIKRLIAWVGIVILAGFYVAALIAALMGNNSLFIAALFASFVVPVLVLALEMLYKWVHRGNAIDKPAAGRMMATVEKEENEKERESENGF